VSRFVALFVALVAGVGAAVWYYRAPDDGSRPVRVVVARNDDRWLDDLLSPDVAVALQEPEFAPEAALALSFMGSAAVPALREAIRSDNAVVRREALRSLGKLRERASIDPQIVVPLLLEALNDPDPSVRNVAVTYLGIVRDSPETEVAGLIKALGDSEAPVRQAAAEALSAYGLLAESAIPALKKATNDRDEDVKREAGRTLVHLAELRNR